tara:strand:+ start:1878 stop:3116 length:1239 start_codon:yes stop_codon:yes gene_type:complete
MNPWIILDIESTADKKAVKRAYLRKLKSVNPEEDQQGFMQVREAYDRVLALIDQGTFHDETPIEESPLSEQAHLSPDAAAEQDSSAYQEPLPEERAHIKAEAVSDEMQAFFDKLDLNHDRQDSEAKVNSTSDAATVSMELASDADSKFERAKAYMQDSTVRLLATALQPAEALDEWKELLADDTLISLLTAGWYARYLMAELQRLEPQQWCDAGLTPEVVAEITTFIMRAGEHSGVNDMTDAEVFRCSRLADLAAEAEGAVPFSRKQALRIAAKQLRTLFFSGHGRIDRRTFFLGFGFLWLALAYPLLMAGMGISYALGIESKGQVVVVGLLVMLGPLLFSTAQLFGKRFHDSGRSQGALFLLLIPKIGLIICLVLACMPGKDDENPYGEHRWQLKPDFLGFAKRAKAALEW